jgi:RNA polymerase sigma-70 factor, ECF subfamily
LNELSRFSETCASESSDDELLCSIQMRDERALAALIQRYGGQVQAVCRVICGDDLEANGVVSDVFWEFWRNSSLYAKQRGSVRAYLLTMARSRSIDRKRAMSSRSRQHSDYIDATMTNTFAHSLNQAPDYQVMNDENAEQIQQALCQLSELQRQLLQLTFFHGMSHREVASSARLPLGTVKTHIRKGLLRLKNLLVEFSKTGECP